MMVAPPIGGSGAFTTSATSLKHARAIGAGDHGLRNVLGSID
jgi:hypothetical protein